MATPDQLKNYLSERKISFELLTHPEAFTAQEVAHAIHKTGKVLAKTIIVEADAKTVMAVVPAHHKVKLSLIKSTMGARDVHLVPEEKLRQLFPDSDLGAMPPIGPLYNMPVVISKELAQQQEVVFNACTHTDCVKMAYTDFERLVAPKVAEISEIPQGAR